MNRLLLGRRGIRLAGLALVLVMAGAGCGSSDDDDDGVAADSGDAPAACSPVGEDLAGSGIPTIPVTLQEFSFTPATIEVTADVVTFVATNMGTENHELAFLPGGGEVPLNSSGDPDEDALGRAGAFELEAFGPGQSCNATYDLEPGTYALFCIVTSPDGQTHYAKGMRGTLTVA